MGMRYTHLDLEERCRLRGLMEMGPGIGEITRRLRRHRATIHSDIGHNRCVDGYRADSVDGLSFRSAAGAMVPDYWQTHRHRQSGQRKYRTQANAAAHRVSSRRT